MRVVRGQRVRLDPSCGASLEVEIELSLPAGVVVDGVCLMLGVDGRVVKDGVVLGAGSVSRCGGILLRASGFTFKLDSLPREVERLVLGLDLRGAQANRLAPACALGECVATARPRTGELVQYAFTGRDFGQETAVHMVEVYRKEGWRFAAVGAGFLGGLPAMLSQYGAKVPLPLGRRRTFAEPGAAGSFDKVRLPTAWPGAQQPQIPQGLVDAVGLVVVETAAGEVHTGTGFAIGPGGLLLTANHNVEEAKQISVVMHGTAELRRAEVVACSPEADVALLWLADRHGTTTWLLLGEPGSTPGLGDEVGLLGFPLGLELGTAVAYSQGIVNSHRNLNGRPVLQIDAGAAPGSSGGPLIRRRDGRIVGILTGGRPGSDTGMHINFATDIQLLYDIEWFA